METQICQLIMMERTKVRYSLHNPHHGDPDLPAHHDGENQGEIFSTSSSSWRPRSASSSYSLHLPHHGDPDLPANHDGEDQSEIFSTSSSSWRQRCSRIGIVAKCWSNIGEQMLCVIVSWIQNFLLNCCHYTLLFTVN
jgi:hypothetical protein